MIVQKRNLHFGDLNAKKTPDTYGTLYSPLARVPLSALPCKANKALAAASLGFVEPFLQGGGVVEELAGADAVDRFFNRVSIPTSSP